MVKLMRERHNADPINGDGDDNSWKDENSWARTGHHTLPSVNYRHEFVDMGPEYPLVTVTNMIKHYEVVFYSRTGVFEIRREGKYLESFATRFGS